ncbi:unnamed protein product, partial [Owenia fusiformis]
LDKEFKKRIDEESKALPNLDALLKLCSNRIFIIDNRSPNRKNEASRFYKALKKWALGINYCTDSHNLAIMMAKDRKIRDAKLDADLEKELKKNKQQLEKKTKERGKKKDEEMKKLLTPTSNPDSNVTNQHIEKKKAIMRSYKNDIEDYENKYNDAVKELKSRYEEEKRKPIEPSSNVSHTIAKAIGTGAVGGIAGGFFGGPFGAAAGAAGGIGSFAAGKKLKDSCNIM